MCVSVSFFKPVQNFISQHISCFYISFTVVSVCMCVCSAASKRIEIINCAPLLQHKDGGFLSPQSSLNPPHSTPQTNPTSNPGVLIISRHSFSSFIMFNLLPLSVNEFTWAGVAPFITLCEPHIQTPGKCVSSKGVHLPKLQTTPSPAPKLWHPPLCRNGGLKKRCNSFNLRARWKPWKEGKAIPSCG